MSANDKNRHSRLAEYRRKRRQSVTPEPFGDGARHPGQFVVHLHTARRRHFDGVLRCWAVPNGPSLDPADKRLAIQTEDHPVEYLDFEQVIPEGNYGAGPMIVWDRGRWVQRFDKQTGENKLLFDLYGHKLRGRWTLVRTRRDPKEWLLIKKVDGWSRQGDEADLPQESVYSGLLVEDLAASDMRWREIETSLKARNIRRRPVNASSLPLMLAKTADAPFSRRGWLFELKYDGYRLVAGVDAGRVYLRYRGGSEATEIYPDLTPALSSLPYDSLVLDGEVVVLGEDGRPDFGRLASRARLSRTTDILSASLERPATYFAFDLLELNGYDLRSEPLSSRKQLLASVVPRLGPVRYSDHVETLGAELFEQVQKMGLEGLVAKRANSRYLGKRSDHWLKIKADRTAALVIVGTVRGKGSRSDLGAILVGVHHGEGLVYVGRVGSGFGHSDIEQLRERLAALALGSEVGPVVTLPEPDTSRRAKLPKPADTAWVRPELACEVRFKEITADGLLRHPVFVRLRPDLCAADCNSGQPGLRHAAVFGDGRDPDSGPPHASASARSAEGPRTLITRPDKIFWPAEGYTKGDLIDYYGAVSDWILPYLRDRPLVLDRYPDGIKGKSFFQKHAPHFTPDWIQTTTVHSESRERDIEYFLVQDRESLLYMANSGAIPLHIWSSRVESLDRPDWAILDLDPKDAPFASVVEVARAIKHLCDQIELECFVKTSGKSGLHVLVPLGRQLRYEQSRMLADLLALIVSRRHPEVATIQRSLHRRGDRVYIDAVQNGPGRLLVSPLCVRPVPGAPVSTPLRWREVNAKLDPRRFTIKTVPARLRRMKDEPLCGVLRASPDLPAALGRLSDL